MKRSIRSVIGVASIAVALLALLLLLNTFRQRRTRRTLQWHSARLEQVLQPSSDPQLRFELIPNHQVRIDGITYGINRLGFRDQQRDIARRNEVMRLLVVGGQAGFGWGLPNDAAIGSQLDEYVNIRDRDDMEVVSACVPGYGLAQATRLLIDRLHLTAPDIVVLFFSIEDLLQGQRDSAPGVGAAPATNWLPSAAVPAPEQSSTLDFSAVRESLQALKNEADSRSMTVVWALLPYLANPDEGESSAAWQRCAELAEAAGFIVVDLLTAFQGYRRATRSLYLASPWAPSAETCHLAAERIWQHLIWNQVLLSPMEILEKEHVQGL